MKNNFKNLQNHPVDTRTKRPKWVTIIYILGFLSAAILFVVGIQTLYSVNILHMWSETYPGAIGVRVPGEFGSDTLLINLIGLIFLIAGAVESVFFYLLTKMRKVGWIMVMVDGLIRFTLFLTVFNYFILAIWIVIVAYLLIERKHFL